ncbi:hypothetical protein LXL04_024295 [Taraxacum kok-saghyz]
MKFGMFVSGMWTKMEHPQTQGWREAAFKAACPIVKHSFLKPTRGETPLNGLSCHFRVETRDPNPTRIPTDKVYMHVGYYSLAKNDVVLTCYSTRRADPFRVGSGLSGQHVSGNGQITGRVGLLDECPRKVSRGLVCPGIVDEAFHRTGCGRRLCYGTELKLG